MNAFKAHGRWLRGNLHCHSTNSDGKLTPAQVCAGYRRKGYDFIALTDHFLDKFGFPISDTRGYRSSEFTTVLGAELHAPTTSRGDWWHILAVGLPPDFRQTGPRETGVQLARRAARAGAFVAVAHPAWYDISDADVTSIDAAHAIEIQNSVSHVQYGKGDSTGYWDRALAAGGRHFAIATDDAHHYGAYGDFGRNWVMVKAKHNAPDAILDALHSGAFYSSQGPTIEDVRIRKGALVVRTSPIRRAWLSSSTPYVTAVLNSAAGVSEFELPIGRMSTLPYARLTVEDSRGRRAYTNAFSVG